MRTSLLVGLGALLLLLGGPGARAQDGVAADSRKSEPDPTKPEEPKPIVYCPRCDTIPGDGDLFCGKDGTELKTLLPPEAPECPSCFRKGKSGDTFCRFDGQKLVQKELRPDEKRQLFELFYGRGLGAERDESWERAAAFFEAAVPHADPERKAATRARAYRARGRHELKENRLEQAVLDLLLSVSLDPKSAETYVALGDLYARGGKGRDALLAYDRAVELDPGLAAARVGRGGVKATRGDREGALEDLAEAIRIDPAHPDPYLRRAVLRTEAGELEPAEADASSAIERSAENAKAWVLRGTIRTRRGQAAQALADLDRAIEIDPKLAEAHFRRGLALLKLGDRGRAETAFAVSVGLDRDFAGAVLDAVRGLEPGATDPRLLRAGAAAEAALAALGKGDVANAVKQMLVALQFAPGDPELLKLLGDAYARLGRTEDAIASFTRALEIAPRYAAALFARGFAHHEAGRLAEAKRDYEAALALEPGDPLALNALGNIQYAQGAIADAERSYSAAIEQDPGFDRAYANRGLARIALGRKDEARRDFEAALLLDPENVETLVQIGLLSLEAGDAPRARWAFRLAAELAPADPLPRYDLALSLEYDDGGRRYGEGFAREEAITAYRQVLRVDPRHAGAALNLGILLLQTDRHEEAVQALRRAATLAPESVSAQYHLGLALEDGEDGTRGGPGARLDEAIQVYGRALGLDEKHVPSLLNRALARIRLGRDEEALEDLDRLRSMRPEDPDIEYDTALALGRLGRREEAEKAVQAFARKGGDREAADALRRSWK